MLNKRIDWLHVWVFLVQYGLVLLTVSITRSIFNPWAEDATHLIFGALSNPYGLASPVLDGVFILSRTVATIATYMSIEYAPFLISVLATFILVGASTYFLKSSFNWLVPKKFRILFSFVIVIGPGALEVAGNAICLEYVAAFMLILLLLERPLLKENIFLFLWTFLVFSSHLSLVTLPLLAARYCIEKRLIYLKALSVVVCSSILSMYLSHVTISAQTQMVVPSFDSIIGTISSGFLIHCLLFPLLGAQLLQSLDLHCFDFLCLTLEASLFFVVWVSMRELNDGRKYIVLGLFGTVLLYLVMHQIARPYHMNHFLTSTVPSVNRMYVIILLPPLIAWLIIFSHLKTLKESFTFALAVSIVTLHLLPAITLWLRYDLRGWQDERWRLFVNQLIDPQRSGSKVITVDIDPSRWSTIQCTENDASTMCRILNGNHHDLSYEFNFSREGA